MLFEIAPLLAQWVENGFVVCTASGDQYIPQVAFDGSGGAIMAWYDRRTGEHDIYAQRIDALGNILWASDANPVCTVNDDQSQPEIISDGQGGAIITWYDKRYVVDYDIFAQRIDAGGAAQWTPNGVPICTADRRQGRPFIAPDRNGGAYILWHDRRSGNTDIYMQRVSADGVIQWDPDGLAVCTEATDQGWLQFMSDGNSGDVYITWSDDRNGDYDIFAQRVTEDSTVKWAPDGITVCAAANSQLDPRIVSDMAGGAIIVWQDRRTGIDDIYAQRIDSLGNALWAADGVAMCSAAGFQNYLVLASDGAGGAIASWLDGRSEDDIYAQRIDPNGVVLWAADGIAVCNAAAGQFYPKITADGIGGVIIGWLDYRYASNDIYAQRIDANGIAQWMTNGVVVVERGHSPEEYVVFSDGLGGAFITWDTNHLGDWDIFAQRIERNGFWGYPAPRVTGVQDVPHDQGGRVTVTWDATRLDQYPHEVVTHYSIWRRLAGSGFSWMIDPGITVNAMPNYGWEWVADMSAANFEEYTYAAPTLYDSIAADTGLHHFLVIAQTEDPFVYWTSEPDSGYSVDNLSPAQPTGFAGIQSLAPEGLRLSWLPNTESDLSHYSIHRGDNEFFVPDGSNQVGTTADTMLIDTAWIATDYYFYKISAVDVHGNVGPEALLRPEDITVETLLQSFAAALVGEWIEVSWVLSEAGVGMKFFVLRAEGAGGSFEELFSPEIEKDGLAFRYIDRSSEPGETYRYRIEVEDEDGRRILFETGPVTTPAMALTLYQNHPNPFNPSTTMRYYLPEGGMVVLDIFDVSGKWVMRLEEGRRTKGIHTIEWNGRDSGGGAVTSGVYFYRLSAGKDTITKKMILLR